MDFEEWTKKRGTYETLSWENDYAEDAWNAAIDEAVKKVEANEDFSQWILDELAQAIKALKQT